jgi:hypothetical protein
MAIATLIFIKHWKSIYSARASTLAVRAEVRLLRNYAAVWSDLGSLQDASLLEGLKIGHDVLDLTSLKLEPRHVRMNPLRQRSLQI